MIAPDLFKDIPVGDRLRGAVWGQFVGDAAALGTHWIYNLTELQQLYPSGVSGFEAPKEGHYHFGKEPGDQTHYGDGALVFLESLAKGLAFIPATSTKPPVVRWRITKRSLNPMPSRVSIFSRELTMTNWRRLHVWRAWSCGIGTTQPC